MKNSGPRKVNVTVVDVARTAGVAVGTVSRYLQGEKIRSKNREKVAVAIAELGYTHNAIAAAMKSGRTKTVGFMIPSLSPFHSDILDRFSRMSQRSGLSVMTYIHDPDAESILAGIQFLLSHQIQTLVIDGYAIKKTDLTQLKKTGVHVISYDHSDGLKDTDGILVDNYGASTRAVEYLIELGHTRIGVLSGDLDFPNANARLMGYRAAIERAGIDFDPEIVVEGDWFEHSGKQNTLRLLSLNAAPTAIFSCNAPMTVGALLALRELDLTIPNDVSLISFDDLPLFKLIGGGITAVKQPTQSIAERLFSVISEARDELSEPFLPRHYSLECDIVLRSSARQINL